MKRFLAYVPTRSAGFALAELLVVIGILAILMSLLLPALGAARASARATACAEQMRNYGVAVGHYASENDGHVFSDFIPIFPLHHDHWAVPILGFDFVWEDHQNGIYTANLVCPDDPLDGNPDPERYTRNSYLINGNILNYGIRFFGPFKNAEEEKGPSEVVVIGEKRPDAVGWDIRVNLGYNTSYVRKNYHWYDLVSLHRHPRGGGGSDERRSNHLFLDLHVDAEPLPDPPVLRDPWWVVSK